MNGVDFVKRIDEVLDSKKERRAPMLAALGLPRNAMNNWETNGNIPAADIAVRIADYLNVSVEWLVIGKDSTGVDGELQSLMRDIQAMPEEKRKNIIIALKAMARV